LFRNPHNQVPSQGKELIFSFDMFFTYLIDAGVDGIGNLKDEKLNI